MLQPAPLILEQNSVSKKKTFRHHTVLKSSLILFAARPLSSAVMEEPGKFLSPIYFFHLHFASSVWYRKSETSKSPPVVGGSNLFWQHGYGSKIKYEDE